jgi:hypothetical protein
VEMSFKMSFKMLADLRKSAVLTPRVKSNGLMHWNYPDFKEIYTSHFSNLAFKCKVEK